MARDWLLVEVIEGLKRLIVLRLENGPALDTIELVAAAWHDALAAHPEPWDEALDGQRLRTGFADLARNRSTWPKPVHLLRAMPERPRRASDFQGLAPTLHGFSPIGRSRKSEIEEG